MSRLVRAVMVWCMVIAAPIQGLAASVMFACAPSHERMATVLSGQDQAQAEEGHERAVEPDCHPAQPAAETSCSACAACCSMLAFPMHFSLPAAAGLAHPMHAVPSAPHPSPEPEGLDRPPRLLTA